MKRQKLEDDSNIANVGPYPVLEDDKLVVAGEISSENVNEEEEEYHSAMKLQKLELKFVNRELILQKFYGSILLTWRDKKKFLDKGQYIRILLNQN